MKLFSFFFFLEHLLEAMQETNNTVQESLALQHKAYLAEITRLQNKSQLLQLMDRNSKTSSVISQATQTDNFNNMNTADDVAMDEEHVYEILRENKELEKSLDMKNEQERTSGSSDSEKKSISVKGNKDEVVNMNQKLNKAVLFLLKELELTKLEKRHMTKHIAESRSSIAVKQGLEEELTFHSLDLPPLEVSYPELAFLKIDG